MDVAIMPMVPETAPGKPQSGPAKSSDRSGKGDSFGGLFATLANLQNSGSGTTSGSGSSNTAGTDENAAESTATDLQAALAASAWTFFPVIPTQGQTAASQTDQPQANPGGINSVTATGDALQAQPRFTLVPAAARQQAPVVAQTTDKAAAEQTPTVQLPEFTAAPASSSAGNMTDAQPAYNQSSGIQAPQVRFEQTLAVPAAKLETAATPIPAATEDANPGTVRQTAPAAVDNPVVTAAAQKPVEFPGGQQIALAVQTQQIQQPKPFKQDKPATPAATQALGEQPQVTIAGQTTPTAAKNEAATTGDSGQSFTDQSLAADQPVTEQRLTDSAADAAPQPQAFAAAMERHTLSAAQADTGITGSADRQTAADTHNVAGQIVDQARLITRAENSEMVIKLKPEHLGELTLKIVVEAGTVSATFHTANPEVRGAIEASLPQLKQDMSNQGIKVDYVGVYASLDHFAGSEQYHTPRQQPAVPTARKNQREEVIQELAAVTASVPQTSLGGIDYRI